MPLAISCALKEIWPVPFYFKEFDVFKVLISLSETTWKRSLLRIPYLECARFQWIIWKNCISSQCLGNVWSYNYDICMNNVNSKELCVMIIRCTVWWWCWWWQRGTANYVGAHQPAGWFWSPWQHQSAHGNQPTRHPRPCTHASRSSWQKSGIWTSRLRSENQAKFFEQYLLNAFYEFCYMNLR